MVTIHQWMSAIERGSTGLEQRLDTFVVAQPLDESDQERLREVQGKEARQMHFSDYHWTAAAASGATKLSPEDVRMGGSKFSRRC